MEIKTSSVKKINLKLSLILFFILTVAYAEDIEDYSKNNESSKFSYFNFSYSQTHFQKNSNSNSNFNPYSSHGFLMGYGKEAFRNLWLLISTEINISMQSSTQNDQIHTLEITSKIHPQYIQYFFSEIGIHTIKKNDDYLSGLNVGAGIVFNHKDILEIPELFNFLRTEEFKKEISMQSYDFFIKANIFIYSNLKADPIVSSDLGIRFYF